MKKIIILSISALAMILMASACQKEDAFGYLQVDLNTLESAFEAKSVTAVPAGYNARRLYVEIKDATGAVVKSTDDYANDGNFRGTIKLMPGKYTVIAHSYGWDGSDSGFDSPYYYGSASATVAAKELRSVNLVCTLANVMVTVTYDNSFRTYFRNASTNVKSLADENIASRDFTMGSTAKTAYFPVGDLALMLYVINMKNNAFVQMDTVKAAVAREHIKINYKVAEAGNMGGVTVSVDDATRTYNFNIPIPRKPGISFECYDPKPWSRFANLKIEITGKTASFDLNKMNIQWKEKTASVWNTVQYSSLARVSDDVYTYKLTGLNPDTEYQYRVYYASDDPVESDAYNFKTDTETALYNGGFEYWYTGDKSIQYPDQSGVSYWNTSNPGSSTGGIIVTVQDTDFKHGGSSSAKLQTKSAVGKLAAGSIYTGDFVGLIGTSGAMLDWGVSFHSRPTALKGWWSYSPGKVDKTSSKAPADAPSEGQYDQCSIFCALLTDQMHVGGNAEKDKNGLHYENSTVINWQTDERVIAYGVLYKGTDSDGKWESFEIPFVYNNVSEKPSYLLVVASSSRYGDFFHGSTKSVLNLDDLELVYGTNISVK